MANPIQLHQCPSCLKTFIVEEADFCADCEKIVNMDLEVHSIVTSLGRLREMPIDILAKRKDLLVTIEGELRDISAEIKESEK